MQQYLCNTKMRNNIATADAKYRAATDGYQPEQFSTATYADAGYPAGSHRGWRHRELQTKLLTEALWRWQRGGQTNIFQWTSRCFCTPWVASGWFHHDQRPAQISRSFNAATERVWKCCAAFSTLYGILDARGLINVADSSSTVLFLQHRAPWWSQVLDWSVVLA